MILQETLRMLKKAAELVDFQMPQQEVNLKNIKPQAVSGSALSLFASHSRRPTTSKQQQQNIKINSDFIRRIKAVGASRSGIFSKRH